MLAWQSDLERTEEELVRVAASYTYEWKRAEAWIRRSDWLQRQLEDAREELARAKKEIHLAHAYANQNACEVYTQMMEEAYGAHTLFRV